MYSAVVYMRKAVNANNNCKQAGIKHCKICDMCMQSSIFCTKARKWVFAGPRLCFETGTHSKATQRTFGRGENIIFHNTALSM